jgi:glutathione S-transferase
MFIAEKGVAVEVRQISLLEGEHFSPEFRAINPNATVPVLVTEEGQAITENNGIAAYLEARFPEPALMGATPDENGAVAMWNALAEQQGGMAMAEALRNAHPAMKGRALPGAQNLDQIPELAERGRKRLAAFFEVLENRLQGREFLAIDSFSWADIAAYCFVDYSRVIKMRIPEGNTATRAWFDKVSARPSAGL